jgi:hypothetical protein
MARNATLDEMRTELARRRKRHLELCIEAGEAEAAYRYRRATKIRDERQFTRRAKTCAN